MSKYGKMYMLFIGIAATVYGCSSFAGIRCGTELISVGDPEYTVNNACGSPVSYNKLGSSRNGTGNEAYAYYLIDGQTIQIHFIDGFVYTIGGDENIN